MMKRNHYKFIILIFILVILIYNIIVHKYKQYKINNYKENLVSLNTDIEQGIKKAKEIIKYKKSLAYKNKILKQDKGLSNKGEKVVYITTEEKYNKYISKVPQFKHSTIKKNINDETFGMSIYQKWIWLIFREDLR